MGLNSRTQRCLENVYFSCVHGAVFSVTSHKYCHPRQDWWDGGGGGGDDDVFYLELLVAV